MFLVPAVSDWDAAWIMSEEILCKMSKVFHLDMYLVTALPNRCHLANTILNLHTNITEGFP